MPRKFFFVSLLLLHTLSYGQQVLPKLESAFNRLLSDPQAKYATTSLCVLDANSGETLFARNENVGVATASTLKTITSATAFSLLGKDFQYQTTLAYSGDLDEEGTLHGSLIIVGGGDPTLGSWRYQKSREAEILSQWVHAVKEAGIKKIDGQVIGDESLWGSQHTPDGWIWQDLGNYYGAGASALSWRENQFDLHLSANGRTGTVSVTRSVPEMPYLKIVNELKAGASGTGDRVYVYLPDLGNTAYLRGTWAVGYSKAGVSAALPDPAYDAAYRLQDTLKSVGVLVTQSPTTSRQLGADGLEVPAIKQKLVSISSPTLSQIIYWFNKKSINLYGEHLLKTLAWKSGKEATTKNGAEVLIDFWAQKGIDRRALNIIDGSGLSPATRVPAATMAEILYRVQKESWFPDYVDSFPENNGMTLKSGSISDVAAYAGYYTNAAGRKYIIVININNYSGSGIRNKLFHVLDALK